MRSTLLLTCCALFVLFACQETKEEQILPEAEGRSISNGFRFEPRPVQRLIKNDISNGFFYLVDAAGQALTIANGEIICHSDYAANDDNYALAAFRKNAPAGLYLIGESVLYWEEGVFSLGWTG